MANSNNPTGFTKPRTTTGGPPSIGKYTATAAIIYPGDAVTFDGSGAVKSIIDATKNTAVPMGVAATYAAASATVYVYDDLANTTFECQVDDTNVTSADIGNLFDLITDTGDTTRLTSKQQLDGSDSVQDNVRVIELVNRVDNDNTLAYNKVRVRFNVFSNSGAQAVTA